MSARYHIFRLALNRNKAVQAVDYVAQRWPGVTQYYVCKIIYFADKAHCLDWGRTITGDRYVAMDHGPVPSRVYEMLKPASCEEDDVLEAIAQRLTWNVRGNRIHLFSNGMNAFPALAQSEIDHLDAAIALCRGMSFSALREFSHRELAWRRASESAESSNPPMDLVDWFEQENMDRERGAHDLLEDAKFGIR